MSRARPLAALVAGALVLSSLVVGGAPAGAAGPVSATRLVTGLAGADLANGSVSGASLTPDRKWMVFSSEAANLVAGDTNGTDDVFVKNLTTGTVTRLSVLPDGSEVIDPSYQPSICDNGELVAFTTDSDLFDEIDDTNGSSDVYVVNRDADNDNVLDEYGVPNAVSVTRMSVATDGTEADFGASMGSISGNCKWVAYVTDAPFDGTDTNEAEDIYVRDTTANVNRLMTKGTSVDGGGGFWPVLSQTGRYLAFGSFSGDLVTGVTRRGVYLRDRDKDADNVFDEDATTAANEYISKSTAGVQPNAASGPDASGPVSMTPDGRCVVFKFYNGFELTSDAPANAVFVRDRQAGNTGLISKTKSGTIATEASRPRVSPNCQRVEFDSSDNALTLNDANPGRDAFVKNRQKGTIRRISLDGNGASALGVHFSAQAFNDERMVITSSAAEIGGAALGDGDLDAVLLNTDLAAPTGAAITAPTGKVKTAATFPVTWTATDSVAVPTYDVQRRSATYNGSFGAYATWQSNTSATSVSATHTTGSAYCWKVRARDAAGNVSAYSTQTCTAVPLKSDALTRSAGWTKVTTSSAYGGFKYRTITKNSTIARSGVTNAEGVYLLVSKCATCGTISVKFGSLAAKTFDLAGASAPKQVLKVYESTTPVSGTVTVTVTSSGKTVDVEGLGIYKD